MLSLSRALFLASTVIGSALAFTATPFVPSAIPLAVRSPYTSAWLPGGTGGSLSGTWPQFWTGATLGWTCYVRVDGTTYTILGAPSVSGATLATQTSLKITSTTSTFVLTAGPVTVTATFLSPIEPTDFLRGSLPFSYLSITTKATDGNSHLIQVYADTSGEWVSTDNTQTVNWSTNVGTVVAHQVQLATQTTYGESGDMVQSGSAWHGILNTGAVTYQSGQDAVVRAAFIANGNLPNTQDTNYRAISNDWPVFGLSKDIGSTSDSTSNPVIFAVGHARSPNIQYITTGSVLEDRYPYYAATYSTPLSALTFFLSTTEYNAAVSAAATFDAKVQSDGSAISSAYADILALSARQVMGGIEITISKSSSGSYNTGDIMAFMKEISSDGNVNTVDVIFPSWSFWLYVNPILGAYLLQPLFIYQQSGMYPNKWSVHDMGASYPKAIGHNDGADEAMPVEECGNMLIMALSYAQKSGDTSQLSADYSLLAQWTSYLVSDSLIPANQISTDDFEGSLANQTNLAIKGVVGIGAMGEIASLLGKTSDATNYTTIATTYVPKILSYAQASTGDHLTLAYGQTSTWGLMYNMFGDKLLGLNLFSSSLYTQQTNWYASHGLTYGLPLDTRHSTWSKSDWQILTSAIVTSTSVRDLFINGVHAYAADGKNTNPLSDWFDASAGTVDGFRARPVVGGHFAHLAL
ncbi:DUF1793-domain-containing protein [Clavulina sp. PMI_390]|nr:DUF1793-domain-containing protein [Clavulina sp. PMI_390]